MAITVSAPAVATNPAHLVRLQCRTTKHSGPTAGFAPGHIQANLLVLPRAYASDFRALCERNPVTCPLLATGTATALSTPGLLRTHFDLRTDLPRYNVYHEGVRTATGILSLSDYWADDHVAFLIGCSFSFEGALAAAGLMPRHVEAGCNVSMYSTKMKLNPAGIFTSATAVVSMRPYRREDVEKARDVTRPFMRMHGEPIAWGWEALEELGIKDIMNPDFGDAVEIRDGEVPVFWGCGVTTAAAIMSAGDKIQGTVLSHEPGHMLMLDVREEEYFGGKQV